MIFINLIASLVLLLSLFSYRFIYPKKNINLLLLLVLISLIPLISVLRKGTYESGDLTIHTQFLMSFYESLRDGNFIPRWSSQIIYGYGYPLFIFAYPLPYYLGSFFHFLGFNFVDSLKIVLASSFILSGITMYLFIKEELKNKLSAFVAALTYIFAPYHLIDLHFRAAIGEVIAFSILPLCFFTIKKISNHLSLKWFSLSATSFALLILSHQAISLTLLPFIVIYCIYLWAIKNRKKFKDIFYPIFSIVFGILLSSFYWLPVILESKYINLLTNGTISFIKLNEIVYSPWKAGLLFQGPHGELSFMLGYAQWIIIVFSVILLLKNKINPDKRTLYLISLISFSILLAMTQSFSKPIWMSIPLLRGFQYSFRMLLLTSFFVSIIAGITVKNISNRLFLIALCFLIIFSTVLNWGNRKTLPQLDEVAIQLNFPNSITKLGEGTTIWVDSNKFSSNQRTVPHIITLQGKAEIIEKQRSSVRHEYLIKVFSRNTQFKENTLYFPGWNVKVDNQYYPINFTSKLSPGIINFTLNEGVYKVEIIFVNTQVRFFSNLLSSFSFFTLALLSLIFLFRKRRKNILV